MVLALIPACSNGATGPEGSLLSTPQKPLQELKVSAVEFEYNRAHWLVPAGRSVSIDFTNRGTISHEWAVLKRGIHIEEQHAFREEMVLFEVESVPERETTSQQFTIDTPGQYQVVCALEGHFDAGMTSSLTVADAVGHRVPRPSFLGWT